MTMVDQLGHALQTAHRAGVVHGDINSDNVLLDDEGNAYLSDFGIAVGAGEVAAKSDISSLGVLVAQALTGRQRWSSTSFEGTSAGSGLSACHRPRHRRRRHAALCGASATWSTICTRRSAGTRDRRRSTLEPETSVENPYKGLRAFDAVDAVDFFGRERLVERLIARLGLSGNPRAVHRRGRSERQRQVERREGRAASCDPAWGGSPCQVRGSRSR